MTKLINHEGRKTQRRKEEEYTIEKTIPTRSVSEEEVRENKEFTPRRKGAKKELLALKTTELRKAKSRRLLAYASGWDYVIIFPGQGS